ncbi:MAG: hypothetical protein IJ706_07405 [Clostridia bacterium]|nr:hypothetical protein [Clostridia bacterium]
MTNFIDNEEEIEGENVKDEENELSELDGETPLETSEEEQLAALAEEGSLDGTEEEVAEAEAEAEEDQTESAENAEDGQTADETTENAEETVENEEETQAAETAENTEAQTENAVETPTETAETEQKPETAENATESAPEENGQAAENSETAEKPKKEEFKLTPPENNEELLARVCAKRARKLIYRPSEAIFELTTTVLGTDKNNEEKIKVKNILDEMIKQGVKLGYLDKFDGLKGGELKEEYENDIVYEFADQEFKRTGLLLDGNKVKVYVFDWDLKALHHVGYIDDESAEKVRPYLEESEKYSFDISGIITGGKYKKVIKDPVTLKVTVEKGNDGNLGLELDITVIPRKD